MVHLCLNFLLVLYMVGVFEINN